MRQTIARQHHHGRIGHGRALRADDRPADMDQFGGDQREVHARLLLTNIDAHALCLSRTWRAGKIGRRVT